jgi:magnesium transporter
MLINCAAHRYGRKLAHIPTEDTEQWVRRPDCLTPVAPDDATDSGPTQMQREFGLHELAVEEARRGHQRPTIEQFGDTPFVVMHLLEMDQVEVRTGEVAILVGARFVLSVRKRGAQHLLGVRERCEREPPLLRHGAGFVFCAPMDAVVDRRFPLPDAIETGLEGTEAQIFEQGCARWSIRRPYALKQRASVLRRALVPLLEVAGKPHGGRVPAVCAATQACFRDVHDHLARSNGSIDAIRDTVGTAVHVNLPMVTIEESETTERLAAWAAIFAVSTALAGVWGMNFEHMPELKWEYGRPVALGAIAAAAALPYWRLRRAGWL